MVNINYVTNKFTLCAEGYGGYPEDAAKDLAEMAASSCVTGGGHPVTLACSNGGATASSAEDMTLATRANGSCCIYQCRRDQ